MSKKISPEHQKSLSERVTEWRAMWISISMQFVMGIQMSVYYMSMWPYLSGLDKTATMDFLGWVVAACNIGCTISNPIYGYWNQKTMSCKQPVVCGLIIASIGQACYGAINLIHTNGKWYMIGARIITGLGTGSLSALRSYAAMASVPKDRMKAVSYGTAGFVCGISFGPVISAAFTPLGESGVHILGIFINMYTGAAYLMCLICICAAIVMIIFFKEDYAGIVDEKLHEKDAMYIVPKYDLLPALVCIYLYMIVSMLATNIEVMATPLTTVLYDWKDSQAILYNGIIESITCLVSVGINFTIGSTRIGKMDKRKQILFGIIIFTLYHIVNYPWWFYSGPLDFLPPGANTTQIGGCLPEYTWCSTTTRVPLPVYLFAFIIFFGVAFPFVESPSAALYSEILGPRNQGLMQGMLSFGASVTPFVASILITFLFQHSGYRYVILFKETLEISPQLAEFFKKDPKSLDKPKEEHALQKSILEEVLIHEKRKPTTFGGKVAEKASNTFLYTAVVAGVGLIGAFVYVLAGEFFREDSPQTIFNRALDIVREDGRCQDIFGPTIAGFGEETARGRRRHVAHHKYEKDGRQRIRVLFHVKGDRGEGIAQAEMERRDGDWEWRFLYVENKQRPKTTHVLIDNR
ncbi:unnamed protein product [Caenorhabditis angaria]|uniref:Major facilitator superfamily (MFS) profile domain-containing protein n=1 Tax=Caenorhabditis angaria TaxID=860376 RepID=A0A9P1N2H0_9PELO|nr:unnamed protein product [Caenorhabditis angaria]